MNWKFLNSGVNSGKFNMDFDVFLAENFVQGNAVLRLYRWNPYCISLGANQSLEDINTSKTRYHQIDVVKRPTGGRAILHSQELTYSVIYPIEPRASAKNIYNEIIDPAFAFPSRIKKAILSSISFRRILSRLRAPKRGS